MAVDTAYKMRPCNAGMYGNSEPQISVSIKHHIWKTQQTCLLCEHASMISAHLEGSTVGVHDSKYNKILHNREYYSFIRVYVPYLAEHLI